VAQVDGVRTVSIGLGEEDWAALKTAVRRNAGTVLLSCGMPGHPKTSRLGTQFFAHDPGAGCSAHGSESAAHLLAKQQVVEAARSAGWSAEPEVAGDGWVADVLAERGDTRVAFEIQLSRQTADEYRTRRQRYKDAKIRGAWFVRHQSSVPEVPSRDLPAFKLTADGGTMTVTVGRIAMPLAEAVTRLLTQKIGFREYVSDGQPSTAAVRYHQEDCWRCGDPSLFWEVESETITGPCGNTASYVSRSEEFPTDRPEASPAVQLAGRPVATSTGIRLALLQRRSTKMSGTRYVAFCCPHCGATFGEVFLRALLRDLWSDADYQGVASLVVDGPHRGLTSPHWCVDSGSGLCAVPSPGTTPTPQPDSAVEVGVQVVLVGDGPGELPVREAVRRMFGHR
jgi:competence protein CoiA